MLELLTECCHTDGTFCTCQGIVFFLLKFCDFTSDVLFILQLNKVRDSSICDPRPHMLFVCAIIFTAIGFLIDIFKFIGNLGIDEDDSRRYFTAGMCIFAAFSEDIPQIVINVLFLNWGYVDDADGKDELTQYYA
jgi:hypothetical protein